MEKRLSLAFALSFLVIIFWSFLFPSPQKDKVEVNDAKKEVVSDVVQKTNADAVLKDKIIKNLELEKSLEETFSLESPQIRLDLSTKNSQVNQLNLIKFNTDLPIETLPTLSLYKNENFTIDHIDTHKVELSLNKANYAVNRTIKFEDDNLVNLSDIIVSNSDDIVNLGELNLYSVEMSNLDVSLDQFTEDFRLHEYFVLTRKDEYRNNNFFEKKDDESTTEPNDKEFRLKNKLSRSIEGEVYLTGYRTRYYNYLIKPEFLFENVNIVRENDYFLSIQTPQELKLLPGETKQISYSIYIGPEDIAQLETYESNFEKVQKFYEFILFDATAKGIFYILQVIHKLIPNWGICIILISFIIYLAMYPLTKRGLVTMKKTQKIQPELVKIREKYKDNPQKQQMELFELYRKEGINPLSGCLPMFFQMPVFIGLYQVLYRSVAFKGVEFLWIKDLSEPDHFFKLPFELPFLGGYLNLLPILMMGIMILQQKISQKNVQFATDEQRMQQKMMIFMMPVMFLVFFYNISSGLTLYFTVFYILSTITQWKLANDISFAFWRK